MSGSEALNIHAERCIWISTDLAGVRVFRSSDSEWLNRRGSSWEGRQVIGSLESGRMEKPLREAICLLPKRDRAGNIVRKG